MAKEKKADTVKIISISAATPKEVHGGAPVEVYGLGDDGELYIRSGATWWKS